MPFGSSKNVYNHSYFAHPYVSIATQLSAPHITAQMAIVKISINLCRFVRSIRGSDICAKWSAIVILGLSFTPSVGLYCYFYNDFTINASLLILHTTRDRCLYPFLVSMYYI